MEKWIPEKPISAIYFNGEKEMYYVKRFLIEQAEKEEKFISEDEKSYLEIVSTDWKPLAEIEFTKERGKDRKDNETINLEEFISVKGLSALGNQLTKEKVKQINLLEPIPIEVEVEEPKTEIELSNNAENETPKDESGQASLF